MQLRVTDQIESERRAALAAGRRRLERDIAARLAGEQSASLEQQQVSWGCPQNVKCLQSCVLQGIGQPAVLPSAIAASDYADG
jgi:hypothetical protein